MAALVLMILSIVLSLGIFSYGIYKMYQVIKSHTPLATNYFKESKKMLFYSAATAVSVLLVFLFLALYHGYKLNAGEWVELLLGSLLFGFGLPVFVYAFFTHYYAKEIPQKVNKFLFYGIFVGIFASLLGLLLLTNGIADHIPYPLVNGISFTNGFVTPLSTNADGIRIKPNLAWYALCILSGAVLVYVICDHRFYVEYGKHGILESTFLVAFPAGIVGARIGYVIGEWNNSTNGSSFAERVANGEWWSPLAIWEGGLTIISGALVGIIVGVLWFIWRNRQYSIWLAVDIIVPCILVAQAVGRWGNFFNAEVHGFEVAKSNWWFLPKIVANNAEFSESANPELLNHAHPGNIFMPLFYIEFLSNLAGYFILRFAVGKGLRKYIEFGDLAFGYIVWYGLTRVIMEPLRDQHYNMGQDGYWSWLWAIVFVLIGTLAIFGNHLVRYLLNRNKTDKQFKNVNLMISSLVAGALLAGSIAMIVIGTINMNNGKQNTSFIQFDKFNNGLIVLVIGLSVLMIFGCAVIYLIQGLKKKEYAE